LFSYVSCTGRSYKVHDLKICNYRHFILNLSSKFLRGMSEYDLIACASIATCLLIFRYGCMAIKVKLKIGKVLYSAHVFCDGCLKSWFGSDWCDQKYQHILYTIVVAVCFHVTYQLSSTAV
jgi:hypothetical protein